VLHVSVLLWLGVTVLYIGFAAVLGVLARHAANDSTTSIKCLAWLHGAFLFTPASIFVLWMPESTPWVQIPVFFSGLAVAYLAFKQPEAIHGLCHTMGTEYVARRRSPSHPTVHVGDELCQYNFVSQRTSHHLNSSPLCGTMNPSVPE